MGNETLRAELSNLERRIRLLLGEHDRLKEIFEAVNKENQELKAQLEAKVASLASFQNQMKITKLVEGMVVGTHSSDELKEVIDDYIKEIDRCIAHLGEQ